MLKKFIVKKSINLQPSRTGRRYYKIPNHLVKQWVIRTLNLLERIFGKDAVHTVEFRKEYEKYNGTERAFLNCHAILVAARDDLKSGSLFNYRGLIKAETFNDQLEIAASLLHGNQKNLACIVAGIALELGLQELCNRNNIKPGKLDKMNADLAKAKVYNVAKQKQITAWAH